MRIFTNKVKFIMAILLTTFATLIFSFFIVMAAQSVRLKGDISINYISFENNCTSIVFDYYDDDYATVKSGASMKMIVDKEGKGLDQGGVSLYYNGNTGAVHVLSTRDIAVDNCRGMFKGWKKLESVKLNNFHTSVVTDMSYMFYMPWSHTWSINSNTESFETDSALKSITFGENFTTTSATNMSNMFSGCSSLESLDVSKFNTSNVKTMANMFTLCKNLTTLNVSGFNTTNVTNMNDMFASCEKLTTLTIPTGFIGSKVTSLSSGNGLGMFSNCKKLTSIDLSTSNVSSVKYMSYLFKNCNELEALNISGWTTTNLTDMTEMFYGCKKLTLLDLSKFSTSNVFSMNRMFYGCENLTTISVGSGWTNSKVISGTNWGVDTFKNCYKLTGVNNYSYTATKVSATYAIVGTAADFGYLTLAS